MSRAGPAAYIRAWAWLATGSLERLPLVLIHETGHLLGMPDLYSDRSPSSQHVWHEMTVAKTGGMFAWHRWKLGWLDDDQVTCLTRRGTIETTLMPVEQPGGKKVLISRVGQAVLVVEVRRAVVRRPAAGSLRERVASSVRFWRRPGVAGEGMAPSAGRWCGPCATAPTAFV
jgi:M6 family metalloprotease-like protein